MIKMYTNMHSLTHLLISFGGYVGSVEEEGTVTRW